VTQEFARRVSIESVQPEQERAKRALGRLVQPAGSDHDDRLVSDAPGDELNGIEAGIVKPGQVVDSDENRCLGGGVRNQLQGRQGDKEPVIGGGTGFDQSERTHESGTMPSRQFIDPAEKGPQELVEGRETQMGLSRRGADAERGMSPGDR
jgi:hypothetical protein